MSGNCLDCCSISFPSASLSYVVAFREQAFQLRKGCYDRDAHNTTEHLTRAIATPVFAAMDIVYHATNFILKQPVSTVKFLLEEVCCLGEDKVLPREFSLDEVVEHSFKLVTCSIVLVASLVLGLFYPNDALKLSKKLGIHDNSVDPLLESLRKRLEAAWDQLHVVYAKMLKTLN